MNVKTRKTTKKHATITVFVAVVADVGMRCQTNITNGNECKIKANENILSHTAIEQ